MTLDVRAGLCTGDGPCDTSPNGPGPNWLTRPDIDGLPPYIRAIMHALRRKGMDEQQAAATAVATVKRWASGGGGVHAATRATAAAAVAQWERKRAESHSRSTGTRDMGAFVATEAGSAAALLPVGPSERQAQAVVKQEERKRDREATPHAFRGKDLEHCTVCQRNVTDPAHGLSEQERREHRPDMVAGGKRHRGPGHPRIATGHVAGNYRRRRQASKQALEADYDAIEPEIAAAMLEVLRRQQIATVSRLDGKRGRQALRRSAAAEVTQIPAKGLGNNCHCCEDCRGADCDGNCCHDCGAPDTGDRAAAPANALGNAPPPARPAPAVAASLQGVAAPAATAGAGLATLSAFPPAIAAQAVALATAVFDVAFWTTATAGVLLAVYEHARQLAIARVDNEIGHSATAAEAAKASEETTTASTTAAKMEDLGEEQAAAETAEAPVEPSEPPTPADALRQRANRMAASITDTTFRQIAEALAQGLEAGEAIGQLTNDVRRVFATSEARARLIARTETIGAYNEAANAQAEWLGPDHVSRKEWLAHHDDRTRPTHRIADGQTVPLGSPFYVGQSQMMYPGDPSAPANETCNCRCGLAFLPPGAERITR